LHVKFKHLARVKEQVDPSEGIGFLNLKP